MVIINLRRSLIVLLSSVCLISNSQAASQVDKDEEEPDKNVEAAVVLPSAPQPDKLVFFYQSESQRFAIDLNSISIPGDGSVRYTLVATSDAGAKNISYEALRCSTYQNKILAIGRTDKTWTTPKKAEWQSISSRAYNKHHSVLVSEYFCAGQTIAGKVSVITSKLKLAKP